MTINKSCARFILCAKSFIKCCDQYSVTGFTSTSHTGSHKQHEPVNKLPKIRWASVTLPTKLGSVDSKSVGITNCGWLPTGLNKCTVPDPHATSNTYHKGECNPSNSRGCRVTGQRSNSGDPSITRQLCVPDFLVEKKDRRQRPVINLKGLNKFVKMEHFKMEGLHLLPDLLQQGDWMAKMHLKDAYLQVPIHPDHQSFPTFQGSTNGTSSPVYHSACHMHRGFSPNL